MERIKNRIAGAVAAAGLAVWVMPAAGQNALGNGTALDKNLQVGSGGKNTRARDIDAQIRFQNAVITGNAPGGKSFRSSVGYLATDDFRASLGSNDLFDFRRDSALSGLATAGIRGTDALRYQFSLSTGQAVPSLLSGGPISVDRSGTAATGAQVTAPLPGGGTATSLRSTSEFVVMQAVQPTVLGYRADKDGQVLAVTASPLLGLAALPVGSVPLEPGAEPGGVPGAAKGVRAKAAGLTGTESRIRGVTGPLTTSTALDTAVLSTRVESVSPTHQVILQQFQKALPGGDQPAGQKGAGEQGGSEPGAGDKGTPDNTKPDAAVPEWQKRLQRLRQQLGGEEAPGSPARRSEPARPAGGDKGGATGTDKPGNQGPQPVPPQTISQLDPMLKDVDPETIRALQRTKVRVDHLAPTTNDMPVYKQQMSAAQTLLTKGRYFEAEDAFLRALAARSGDAMAGIGRVHAQLGAGLFLSAGQNLRSVLTRHPELVGVRYAPELLPSERRSVQVMDQLRIEAQGAPGAQGGLRRDAALLLAYLGYQRQDAEAIKVGLGALETWTPADDDAGRTLLGVLRAVWLDQDAPPTPAPAPAPPPPGNK